MEEKRPRLLKAEEIEVKIKKLYPKGAVALLYKTARVDMDILDETFGPAGWSKMCIRDRYDGYPGCG